MNLAFISGSVCGRIKSLVNHCFTFSSNSAAHEIFILGCFRLAPASGGPVDPAPRCGPLFSRRVLCIGIFSCLPLSLSQSKSCILPSKTNLALTRSYESAVGQELGQHRPLLGAPPRCSLTRSRTPAWSTAWRRPAHQLRSRDGPTPQNWQTVRVTAGRARCEARTVKGRKRGVSCLSVSDPAIEPSVRLLGLQTDFDVT